MLFVVANDQITVAKLVSFRLIYKAQTCQTFFKQVTPLLLLLRELALSGGDPFVPKAGVH